MKLDKRFGRSPEKLEEMAKKSGNKKVTKVSRRPTCWVVNCTSVRDGQECTKHPKKEGSING
jgi:hypothetical protein